MIPNSLPTQSNRDHSLMHRILLVIAYGLKGVSEGAFEHRRLSHISLSHSSMGWRLLRARTSFTGNPILEFLSTEQRECHDVDLPCPLYPHNNHNMNKSSSSPRFPRNCELLPRVGSSMRTRMWQLGFGPGRRKACNVKCARSRGVV